MKNIGKFQRNTLTPTTKMMTNVIHVRQISMSNSTVSPSDFASQNFILKSLSLTPSTEEGHSYLVKTLSNSKLIFPQIIFMVLVKDLVILS